MFPPNLQSAKDPSISMDDFPPFGMVERRDSGPAHLDRTADLPDYDAIERQVTGEIQHIFTQSIRFISASALSVPTTRNGGTTEGREALTEAISDRVAYGAPLAALVRVLESSDCPLVQKLREALAADYAKSNAADVAQVRGDAE